MLGNHLEIHEKTKIFIFGILRGKSQARDFS